MKKQLHLWQLNHNGCTCGICNEPITDETNS